MLAPSTLPSSFAEWNRDHHAPFGRSLRIPRRFGWNRLAIAYRGPFALQPNNSTRTFEYPWAFSQIGAIGTQLDIVEIGGGLSGMQFALAANGHRVTNIDPGESSEGLGWPLQARQHAYLCDVFRAPVVLHHGTIETADIPDHSADVILSISALEHLTSAQIDAFVERATRILKPGGHVVLTVDLFLDLYPFTTKTMNRWGQNVNIRQLLERMRLQLVAGAPAELYGFDEFEPVAILERLSQFAIGNYPGMVQCFVGRAV